MIDFTTGKPMKQILIFSVPLLMGNLLQSLFQVADAMIVGRFIGGTSLAAVGSSMAIIHFLIGALAGLATGASIVISQFLGAKKDDELKLAVSTSMIAMVGLALILTVFGVLGAGTMLRLLGVEDIIFADAETYLRVFMAGIVFPIYLNVYMAYMRALGDSRSPLILLAISAVLNVVFTIMFIVVFDWGMVGVSLATIIANAFGAIACMFIAERKIPQLRLRLKDLKFDKKIFKLILRYGVPASVQLSITSLASLTIMRLVNSLGAVATAGFSVGLRVENFAMMPLLNINMAIATFVGQNIGAGNETRAKQGLRSGMKLILGIGIVTSAILLFFGADLMRLFVEPDYINAEGIIREGALYLSVISMFFTLFGIFFAFNGFFRGVGDQVTVMILTIISLTLRATLAHVLILGFGWGLEAVAWSMPVGWLLCSIYAVFHYKLGRWKGKTVVNRV